MAADSGLDLGSLPSPSSAECNILSESICNVILRDNSTVILSFWSALQLTWVSMLVFVQCIQVARAITTYESMRGIPDRSSNTSAAFTAMVSSGSTTMEGAQLAPNNADQGHHAHAHPGHSHQGGCFAQWKKLLGLDTFMATAQGEMDRGASHRRSNPYSRGIVTNCRDFWCDPAPLFKVRETGAAMLDGEIINYNRMYEVPPRMKRGPGRLRDEEALYHNIRIDNS